MIRIIGVTKENKLIKLSNIDDIPSANMKWYWIDFDRPSEDEVSKLRTPLQYHPLAIEDCIHKLQRPKLDYYEDHSFFVIQSIAHKHLKKEEINIFLSERFITTFHYSKSEEINKVWTTIESSQKLKQYDTALIFYQILDNIVDNYFPYIYKIEDRLNDIENHSKHETMEKLLDSLYKTRHELLSLWHTISPMTDLVYRMLNSHRLEGIHKRLAYFSDIHDHLLKLSVLVEANRELTADIRDSYISLNSYQMNRVMKILTVFTTIFMPLTFIVGVYGMNFKYMPELSWKYGYITCLFVMFIIGAGMTYWFIKKGWFK
ncbi:magnesium/cobalt transporter CorA [Heyndrickxia ginsengihumi]|uniref:Magnesium transport protein CorA n=1 Tax=Heyndrickxia ginsengihumi TaxID=363870 RepID=A0A0A6XWS3_9BACI|nr:magnesium/cobalt transporter CorA [Heyndrickxia ginsengihumi]KHD84587.1 metal transporter [Heyndrickxia ginsengihumi]MBE6184745.1 magnesium/cobalt transporter CorA [Bacillus sp. (in: firmicutes)]MCM3022969.1 magnesium/cobalt transporter CorA [Heyndrickxia ginsengihumi]